MSKETAPSTSKGIKKQEATQIFQQKELKKKKLKNEKSAQPKRGREKGWFLSLEEEILQYSKQNFKMTPRCLGILKRKKIRKLQF